MIFIVSDVNFFSPLFWMNIINQLSYLKKILNEEHFSVPVDDEGPPAEYVGGQGEDVDDSSPALLSPEHLARAGQPG